LTLDVNLTIAGDLQALRLQPTDVLVVSIDRDLTGEESNYIAERLTATLERAGLGNPVIVAPRGVTLGVQPKLTKCCVRKSHTGEGR
jgi:hypothetical protein